MSNTPFQIALIGSGVMGEVLAKGILAHQLCAPQELLITSPNVKQLARLAAEIGCATTTDNRAALDAEVILLAVKPGHLPSVLDQLQPGLTDHKPLILSIIAGATLATIAMQTGPDVPIVRVMTNTACLVGKGMSVLAPNPHVSPEQLARAEALFSAVGETVVSREEMLDAVTGLSGSGPAYIFLIAETLIDAGVLQGLPRAMARQLVLQTMIGSAELLRETGQHPGSLRDMVTSPGGTTITGIQVMEEYKVRAALLKVVEAATQRSAELGHKVEQAAKARRPH
ncbi:MAG: pyrroline-5-carboxylate reductase [Candidatus Sericytochromatia bacterium]|nr:pyrroline-5-carboxylate reductase [Candidatus Sericytochromatia bacterium]